MRLLIAFLVLPLAGCSGSTPASNAAEAPSGLRFALSVDKSVYAVGERVTLTFTVDNTGTTPVSFELPRGDFEIEVLQQSLPVWLCSRDCIPLPPGDPGPEVRFVQLLPGQSLQRERPWDQLERLPDNRLVAVNAGVYTASAWLIPLKIGDRSFSRSEAEAALRAPPITVTVQ